MGRSGKMPRTMLWRPAGRDRRRAQGALLLVLLAWFAYTRLYFVLHPRGLTFDPSLFMYLTGRPDPSCGLTRTFAWMWRGDLGQAARVYPLGPLLFAIAVVVAGYLVVAIARGQHLALRIPATTRKVMIGLVLVAFAANWAAKLIWLGM